jgi:hypothetical protein
LNNECDIYLEIFRHLFAQSDRIDTERYLKDNTPTVDFHESTRIQVKNHRFRDHDGTEIMAQFVLEISDTRDRFHGNCPPALWLRYMEEVATGSQASLLV